MRRFRIEDREATEEAPELQAALAGAYLRKQRPLCLCRETGVPMYIARIDDQYVIKRMPFSGGNHDPACPSHEPPYELSGLGPLIGGAIQIDMATGSTALKLGFSLSRTGSRAPPAASESTADTVRNEASRLSLKALLHLLWQEGELTEWSAAWTGKRGWGKVRSSLLEAARAMTVRRGPLGETLFIPEPFRAEDKPAIAARRASLLAGIEATGKGPRRLMLLIGEVKEVAAARGAQRLVIKHLPDYPCLLEDAAWRRLQSRFATELELWRADANHHLVAIATFGVGPSGMATIEEIGVMVTTENWVPFESVHELRLLERLARLHRKSVKGLRYNCGPDVPVVCAILPEPRPDPVALYIVPRGAGDAYEGELARMIEARPEFVPWMWRPADGDMPEVPW